MRIRLAVISDMHCSSRGPDEQLPSHVLTWKPRIPEEDHPVSALVSLIGRERLRADAVLVPGDLTDRVDRQGLLYGWLLVQEMQRELRAKVALATLGNHDVRTRPDASSRHHDPIEIARSAHPDFPTPKQASNHAFWGSGYCIHDLGSLRVLVLDSALAFNEVDADRGQVSLECLHAADAALEDLQPKLFQVALVHHHPIPHEALGLGAGDLMEHGSAMVDLLARRGFCLVVHGHKHHARLMYAGGAARLPVLACGSFSSTLMDRGLATNIRNLFHLITLERDAPDSPCLGLIESWQFNVTRGWNPATYESTLFPRRTGFGPPVPTQDLVSKTLEWLADRAFAEAADLVSALPQLLRLTPDEFLAYGTELASAGARLLPPAPDVPEAIGRPREASR